MCSQNGRKWLKISAVINASLMLLILNSNQVSSTNLALPGTMLCLLLELNKRWYDKRNFYSGFSDHLYVRTYERRRKTSAPLCSLSKSTVDRIYQKMRNKLKNIRQEAIVRREQIRASVTGE